jgi:hypothetical protein
VPKSGSLGSVRGAGSNACPYRETQNFRNCANPTIQRKMLAAGVARLRLDVGAISLVNSRRLAFRFFAQLP